MATPLVPNETVESLLAEVGARKVASQHDVIEQLDNKSSVLLGFSLVSVVELLGFLLLVAAENPNARHSQPFWVIVVFLAALVSVLGASVAGFLALRHNSSHAFRASDFADLRQKREVGEFRNGLLDRIDAAMKLNFEVIRQKRIWFRIVMFAVGLALMFYTILAARFFVSSF
ncbi:MAG: hypothetical protein ACLQLC_01430 [Candidatus Sulfotelmatobacter sp.]